MRRLRPLAAVLGAVLLPGCVGPQPRLTIGGATVPIDVAFGAVEPGRPGVPATPPVRVVPVPAGGVLPVFLPPPSDQAGATAGPTGPAAPRAPAPPCPPTSPLAPPAVEADTQVTAAAPEGTYPYRVTGTYTLDGTTSPLDGTLGYRVSDSELAADGSGRFTMTATADGVSVRRRYVVSPPTDVGSGAVALAELRGEGGGPTASYEPVKPLTELPLPAAKDLTFRDTSTDPLTGSAIVVDGVVNGREERVEACGEPVDAWKVTTQRRTTSGGQVLEETASTWYATQYGGMPVRFDFTYAGTFGGSSFSAKVSQVINVVPGRRSR